MAVHNSPADIICLRYGTASPTTEQITDLLDELSARDKAQAIMVNSDMQELKNIMSDDARKLLKDAQPEGFGGAEGGDGFDEGKSRELFKAADRDISPFFGGFPTKQEQLAEYTRLLAAGADPNFGDDYGNTLTCSCWKGSIDAMKLLIATGKCDVNWKAPHNQTTALHEICRGKNAVSAEMMRILLDAGADATAKNSSGWSPLHNLADEGLNKNSAMMALMLVEAGQAFDEKVGRGGQGSTPLDLAQKVDTYDEEQEENKKWLLTALQDPKAYNDRVAEWKALMAKAALEREEYAKKLEDGVAGQRIQVKTMGYGSINGRINLSATLEDGSKLDSKRIQLQGDYMDQTMLVYPGSMTSTGDDIPFPFLESVWRNFFEREHNFSEQATLWFKDDENFYCKILDGVRMKESEWPSGENKWTGVTITIALRAEEA